MTIQPLRKFFGLLLLYIVIIFGIFVLQFRNESSIIHSIKQLKILLTENKDTEGTVLLKNRLEITYPGIKIAFNDHNPVRLITENHSTPLVLESWETPSDETAVFLFTNNVKLTLTAQDNRLSMTAALPAGSQLSLPYQTAGGYSITGQTPAQVIISSKNTVFALTAGLSTPQEIIIPAENSAVSYAVYTPKQIYAFENSLSPILAGESAYRATVTAISERLIAIYNETSDTGGEQTVISYVAAMGERSRYLQALSNVSDSFKNSRNRTYLSTPFFGSLVEMNRSLVMQSENLLSMMNYAVQRKSLDFFTVPLLADYLVRETNTQRVTAFLSMPAEMPAFEPSVVEASGILDTYSFLASARHNYAALLEPVLERCLNTIAASCVLDGNLLTVVAGSAASTPRAEPLPLVQAVAVGAALINYGTVRNQTAVKNTGYYIINSLCADTSKFDLRTLGELYPRLVRNNTYYPHSSVLAAAQGRTVWAWHVSRTLSYATDARGDVTITIDFPAEHTEYLIIKGILPFRSIEIYDMPYRTDPRFETYNSSGYIYNAESQTLFLKSRQKTQREIVRLIYYAPAVQTENTDESSTDSEQSGNVSSEQKFEIQPVSF